MQLLNKLRIKVQERGISHVIRWPIVYAVQKTGLGRLITIQRRRYKIRLHPKSIIAFMMAMRVEGEIEHYEQGDIVSCLATDSIVVDVGANIGTFSLSMASALSQGHVFAFEPHPATFGYLKENVALNQLDNITLFQMALGKNEGMVSISNRFKDAQNHILGTQTDDSISVQQKPLDDALKPYDLSHITLLKIDVEGYEVQVLHGAMETLRSCDAVLIELVPNHLAMFDSQPAHVTDILQQAKLTLYWADAERKDIFGFRDDSAIARCLHASMQLVVYDAV